jgi:hypothetical protein
MWIQYGKRCIHHKKKINPSKMNITTKHLLDGSHIDTMKCSICKKELASDHYR